MIEEEERETKGHIWVGYILIWLAAVVICLAGIGVATGVLAVLRWWWPV